MIIQILIMNLLNLFTLFSQAFYNLSQAVIMYPDQNLGQFSEGNN